MQSRQIRHHQNVLFVSQVVLQGKPGYYFLIRLTW